MEKLEPLGTGSGNVKWYSCCGKQYGGPSKNLKYNYHVIQQFYFWNHIQIPLLSVCPKELKAES